MATEIRRIVLRNGKKADFNPDILTLGEPAFITDTGELIFKKADGSFVVFRQLEKSVVDEFIKKFLDENPIEGAGNGLTNDMVNALDALLKKAVYIEDVTTEYSDFRKAFGLDGSDTGEEEQGKTIDSISVIYTGGSVTVGTTLTTLTGIKVTAHYSDGSSSNVTGYTLSGAIAEGSNIITVAYGGKTTTFTVVGIADNGSGDKEELTEPVYALAEAVTFDGTDVVDTGYKLLDVEKSWSVCVDFTDTARGGTVWDASPNGSQGLALSHNGVYYRRLWLGGSLYKDLGSVIANYKVIVTHLKNTDSIQYHFVVGDSTLESSEITYTQYLTDRNIVSTNGARTVKIGGNFDSVASYKGTVNSFKIYERVLSTDEINEFVNTTNNDIPSDDSSTETIEAVYTLAEATTFDGTTSVDTGYILNDEDKNFSMVFKFTQNGGMLFDASKNANLFGPYFTFTGNYFRVGNRVQINEMSSTQETKAILTHKKNSGIFKLYILNDTTNNAIYEYEHTYETYATDPHIVGNTNTLKLGSKYTGNGDYMSGTIHQFEIYERVLTSDEINEFMGV